jgi:GNAT superfamily N-acetyltransferase
MASIGSDVGGFIRRKPCILIGESPAPGCGKPRGFERAIADAMIRAVSFSIRDAEPGEEETVLATYEWLFAPPGSRPPAWEPGRARLALAEAIASDRSTVIVAEDADGAGPPIGLCTAYLDLHSVRFGLRCWVEDLAVDPARRSEGIGAALLDRAREWAAERGATHLELDTAEARKDAQRFYERERPSWRSISYAWEL